MGSSESTEAQPEPLGAVVGHDDIKTDMEEIIKSNDVEEAKIKIKELLGKWKKIPVNVCLLGERGVGKSSFINNLIGNGRKEAKIGVKETTKEAEKFQHPHNENLCFWDLPGYGAKLYKTISEFVRAMDMKRFDVILFLHKSTFSAMDFELYEEIKKTNKQPLIVRTHFDIDSQDVTESDYADIKEDIVSEIREYGLPIVPASTDTDDGDTLKCYFISNRVHGYDHKILMNDILAELKSSEKRDAFTFSLTNQNKTILELKRQRLEKRILVIATIAAATGAIPIPGVDTALNIVILLEEVKAMARILGVNHILQINSTSESVKCCRMYLTKQGLLNLAKTISVVSALVIVDDALKLIPVIGTIIGGLLSSSVNFVLAKMTLKKVLEMFLEVAQEHMEIEGIDNIEIEMKEIEANTDEAEVETDVIGEINRYDLDNDNSEFNEVCSDIDETENLRLLSLNGNF